ncbi:MAG: hypothetical protein KGZ35_04375 [Truepera sp.]|nr:hypothetical protein [Truepera sp.]
MNSNKSRLPVCVLLATTAAIGFLLVMVTSTVAFPGFEDWLDAIFGESFIAMSTLITVVFAAALLFALYGKIVKQPAEHTLVTHTTVTVYAVLVGAGGVFMLWLISYLLT